MFAFTFPTPLIRNLNTIFGKLDDNKKYDYSHLFHKKPDFKKLEPSSSNILENKSDACPTLRNWLLEK